MMITYEQPASWKMHDQNRMYVRERGFWINEIDMVT